MFDVSFMRAVKAGIKNFFRNGWLSISTTSVMALTLLIASVLLALMLVSGHILAEIQDKISVSVYFYPETPLEKIMEIKENLELSSDIKEVDYTSRDDALGALKSKYENNDVIIDSLRELNENPLEASLSILVHDPSKYESLENELVAGKYKDYISKMDYSDHKGEIEKLNKIIVSIKSAGLIIISILIVVAILVTFNSIRLTMYTYRNEVEIMRLVGASNWFVRLPFITEGVLYGIFAAVIVTVLGYPLVSYLAPFFQNSGLEVNPMTLLNQHLFLVIGFELFVGIILGSLSSFLAIRRYLKM